MNDMPGRGPIQDQLRAGLARFPAPALLAFLAASLVSHAIAASSGPPHILFAALAGFTWSMAAALLMEGRGRPALAKGAPLIPAALVALWIMTRPTDALATAAGLPLIAAGVAASVVALTRPGRMDRAAGWGALREDGLGALVAIAIALTACVGLSAALGLINLLVDGVNDVLLSMIWGMIMLFGAPAIWFARLRPLEAVPDAPGGFYRGVSLYLLGPLTVVYLVTLHGLALKLFPDLRLPDGATGWVVAPFLAVAAVTLQALAGLAHTPLLARILFWAPAATLAPAAVMLIAAGERMEAYGLTEPRIFLALLGLWALAMALGGYLWRPLHGVRAQAGVLAGALTVVAFAATPLAIASQRAALDAVLADDAAMEAAGPKRIRSIAGFLDERDAITLGQRDRAMTSAAALRTTQREIERKWCRWNLQRNAPHDGVIAIDGYRRLHPSPSIWIATQDVAPSRFQLKIENLGADRVRATLADGSVYDLDFSKAAAAVRALCADSALAFDADARLATTDPGVQPRAAFIIRELALSRDGPDAPWRIAMLDGDLLLD